MVFEKGPWEISCLERLPLEAMFWFWIVLLQHFKTLSLGTKICKSDLSRKIAFNVVDKCYQGKGITEEKGIEKARKGRKRQLFNDEIFLEQIF